MSHWKYAVPALVILVQTSGVTGAPPNAMQPSNAIASPVVAATPSDKTSEQLIAQWSEGPVEGSLFAKLIGSAEGTRSVDGGKTSLYEHHTDPGNGVNNRGSFSYQFGNEENLSAEESSRRQLDKILGHLKDTVLPQSKQAGITLTPWELINASDLANQAPLCITEAGGYIERLIEARKKAKAENWDEYQMVLWARVESFWDSSKNAYDAGGLRAYDDKGKRESVLRDQDRRMNMMKQAMERLDFKIAGGSNYKEVSYSSVTLQKFFTQAKGVPSNRIPNGSRGDRVAPLEYTQRFNAEIGLVNTQMEK